LEKNPQNVDADKLDSWKMPHFIWIGIDLFYLSVDLFSSKHLQLQLPSRKSKE